MVVKNLVDSGGKAGESRFGCVDGVGECGDSGHGDRFVDGGGFGDYGGKGDGLGCSGNTVNMVVEKGRGGGGLDDGGASEVVETGPLVGTPPSSSLRSNESPRSNSNN